MANQSFDTTIINPLERPKSSDINAAQSELRRSLLDYLQRAFAYSSGAASLSAFTNIGFMGNGFAVTASSPASMVVNISAGMGFSTGSQDANVAGIAGLNDLSVYKPLYLSATKQVTVPTAPGAGFCRRDAIYVRVTRQLADPTSSDVYSVALGVFTPQTINKTMTFDLAGQTPQVIEAGSGTTWTSSIVYAKGAQTAYTTADDFLTAPITNAPLFQGWFRIAVINVGPNDTAISQGEINDTRSILATNGVYEITGSATLGGADAFTSTAQQLSNVVIKTPPGIRCSISKDTTVGYQNAYILSVFCPATISDITATFTPYMPLSAPAGGPYTTRSYPMMVATQARIRNAHVIAAGQTVFANSALTSPAQTVAIGQQTHQIQFSVGRIYDEGSTGTQYYNTDTSIFTYGGGPTQTIDVCFRVSLSIA